MFNNISEKIKILACVITWVGIIASIIGGIVIWTMGIEKTWILLYGCIVMIAGSLFSWVASFVLYGFGELIEKATIIAENTSIQIYTQQQEPSDYYEEYSDPYDTPNSQNNQNPEQNSP